MPMSRKRKPLRGLMAVAACGGLAMLAACGDAPLPPHVKIPGADPERGRVLVYSYGCGVCHVIPGIRGARGTVGPPLERFAGRNIIAGFLPNAPAHLIAWIMDPPAIAPRTAMPDMDIAETEARDIASYLYTLGAEDVAVYPAGPPLPLAGREKPALNAPYPTTGGGGS